MHLRKRVKDLPKPMRGIKRVSMIGKTMPPTPDPAMTQPSAYATRRRNQCVITLAAGKNLLEVSTLQKDSLRRFIPQRSANGVQDTLRQILLVNLLWFRDRQHEHGKDADNPADWNQDARSISIEKRPRQATDCATLMQLIREYSTRGDRRHVQR